MPPILPAIGTALAGAATGAIAGKAGELVGGLFGKKDTAAEAAAKQAKGMETQYTGAETELKPLLEAPETDPRFNQLTQEAIQRATEKARRELGVTQSQMGISGGQATLQQARQAGDIEKEMQTEAAMQRRKEMLEAREAKRGYYAGKIWWFTTCFCCI